MHQLTAINTCIFSMVTVMLTPVTLWTLDNWSFSTNAIDIIKPNSSCPISICCPSLSCTTTKKTLLTYIENKISLSFSLSIYQFINLSIYLFLSVSVSVSLNINIYVYMCVFLKDMRDPVWVCFPKFISFCNQIPWVIFVQIIANNGEKQYVILCLISSAFKH